jgi:hypothetical protein
MLKQVAHAGLLLVITVFSTVNKTPHKSSNKPGSESHMEVNIFVNCQSGNAERNLSSNAAK